MCVSPELTFVVLLSYVNVEEPNGYTPNEGYMHE